ncbi:uncharacterized protein BJX67DRAFT_103870 [Aspergillus lucknowensis]|uniref:Uncharacterized protein n=1 Tax=Aspergillus lucknowensis TaxID=176173 RepID=A0ABR4M6Q7_9EURO
MDEQRHNAGSAQRAPTSIDLHVTRKRFLAPKFRNILRAEQPQCRSRDDQSVQSSRSSVRKGRCIERASPALVGRDSCWKLLSLLSRPVLADDPSNPADAPELFLGSDPPTMAMMLSDTPSSWTVAVMDTEVCTKRFGHARNFCV